MIRYRIGNSSEEIENDEGTEDVTGFVDERFKVFVVFDGVLARQQEVDHERMLLLLLSLELLVNNLHHSKTLHGS